MDYLSNSQETPWTPDMEYYCNVIGRLVDNILLIVIRAYVAKRYLNLKATVDV